MGTPLGGWPTADALADLVRRAQRAEYRALDTLLETIRPPLLTGYARRLPTDLAEDCAQIALIRIARVLPRIDPPRAERYIRRLARNAFRTARLRAGIEARRRAPLDVALERAAPEHDDRGDGDRSECIRALHAAVVVGLPSPLRELVLDVFEGHSTSEIAARQHVSPITIRTRLLRARSLLYDALQASLPSPRRRRRYEPPTIMPCPAPPPKTAAGPTGWGVPLPAREAIAMTVER